MWKSNILNIIKSRRTIRRYKNKKIPGTKLNLILEAGQWSQSVHNQQPWKFIIIKNKNKIKKIGDILLNFASHALIGFNIVLRETAENIKKTPVLIAVYNTHDFSKRIKKLGKPYTTLVKLFEIQSIAACIQNMCLVAHDLKLGSAWLGGALFCEEKVNEILNESDGLMAIISLGYFNEPKSKSGNRKDISAIVKTI